MSFLSLSAAVNDDGPGPSDEGVVPRPGSSTILSLSAATCAGVGICFTVGVPATLDGTGEASRTVEARRGRLKDEGVGDCWRDFPLGLRPRISTGAEEVGGVEDIVMQILIYRPFQSGSMLTRTVGRFVNSAN